MSKDSQNVHSEVSPHPNGKREGIINDSKGLQTGVTLDAKRSWNEKEKELNLQPDEKIRSFKQHMESIAGKED
ncbi:hypothetical protein SAMN05216353_13030 [Halobacillus alkaliphilus]|uniref:Uncharacterized protein n=1 Tax=Halobacillus alkaliphilus TaxID=396056 RepID=A0A1I2Q9J4_9BACI|nr:hypothetical protein [Halobacillus alkaliphilus]SFG25145.1 hypothetical protein SAMN05216353_13030 [Halobacillus alkaliphilus]